MKKFLFLLIPAFAVLLVACPRGRDGRIEHVKSKISSELDLNAEQKLKLDDLALAIKEQSKLMRKQKHEVPHDELKALLAAPTLDPEQSKAFYEKRKAELTARADAMYDVVYPKLAALHATLTDEQKKKAGDLIDMFHKRMHKDKD